MERVTIEVKRITKEIGSKKSLDNIDLTAHASEILALIGPNGSGTCSLCRALVGLINVDQGKISYFNHSLKNDKAYIMNFVGYKPSLFVPWKKTSLIKYFTYSSKFYQGDFLPNALRLMEYFHLMPQAKLENLTAEELQKVAIIDAIYFDPEVIILENLMTSLSADTKALVKALLLDLKARSKTIIFTANNLDDADFADTKRLMKNGAILPLDSYEHINKDYKRVLIKAKRAIDLEELRGPRYKGLVIDGDQAFFIYLGDVNSLLAALGNIALVDISITNPCLEELYRVIE